MALINYIEPVNTGAVFIGIGVLIVTVVFAIMIYRFFRPVIGWVENGYNRDTKYGIVEEKMLDEIAKKKGIDLDKELLKRNLVNKENKSFRKKIEEEVFNEMFPKDKQGKK